MTRHQFNIIGAGAIGHLWAAFLKRQQLTANVFAKQARAEQTLQVHSSIESFSTTFAYRTLAQWTQSDVVLICVKAYQLEQLCQSLHGKLTKNQLIILMMNGMGLIEIVNQYFPDNKVFHAYLTHGAYMENNHLYHTGLGTTVLGNIHSSYSQHQLTDQMATLNQSLPTVSWSENHLEMMYLKLFINAVINPITALLDINNGSLIKNNQLIEEAQNLINELSPLAKILIPETAAASIYESVLKVAMQTATNSSSMRQDINNRRPTEIEYITGYLLKLAKQHQISTSLNQDIYNQIKELEKH